jgi:hypothetical protein
MNFFYTGLSLSYSYARAGAYYGEGKGLRGKGISTFVCGVKDDRNPSIYHTVCKVGTGYSFDELLALRKIIAEICVPWQPGRPPAHLAHWKMPKKDTPNVYIPPEKSIVVQLKCAEIVPSANFSSGLCCRFPRIQCIRHDKAYTDIMSMRDLQDLKQQLRNTTMVRLGFKFKFILNYSLLLHAQSAIVSSGQRSNCSIRSDSISDRVLSICLAGSITARGRRGWQRSQESLPDTGRRHGRQCGSCGHA